MNYLSAEEILLIHFMLIERYGGSHGTRDLERIKSAAVAPSQEVFGQKQYPTVFEKAAVYACNIIADHPFRDGNKRTGMATAAMFLKRNGYLFTAPKGKVEDFAVYIAVKKPEVSAVAEWFKRYSKKS